MYVNRSRESGTLTCSNDWGLDFICSHWFVEALLGFFNKVPQYDGVTGEVTQELFVYGGIVNRHWLMVGYL